MPQCPRERVNSLQAPARQQPGRTTNGFMRLIVPLHDWPSTNFPIWTILAEVLARVKSHASENILDLDEEETTEWVFGSDPDDDEELTNPSFTQEEIEEGPEDGR